MKITIVGTPKTKAFVVVYHDDGRVSHVSIDPVSGLGRDEIPTLIFTDENRDFAVIPVESLEHAEKVASRYSEIKELQRDLFGVEDSR